jgi:hypothetical protein
VPSLIALVKDQTVDELALNPGALHALWTMHGLNVYESNAAARAAAEGALRHPAGSVRRAALQVLPRAAGLVDGMVSAGIVPDRASPWEVSYTVASSFLQDADARVRLEAVLTMAELPPSPRIAATAAEMLFVPDNARDPAIPEAIGIVGAKQGSDFLNAVLQRRAPGDSLSVLGIARAVQVMAQSRAVAADNALVAMVANIPQLNQAVARALLQGVVAGWPDERSPELSAEQRAALRRAASGFPAPAAPPTTGRGGGGGGRGGVAQSIPALFAQLGARWGDPTLFQQQ